MLGVTLHALERSEEALPWFESASRSRGGATLWTNHAAALLALGKGREAVALARRAIAAEPRHAGAWLNLGLALAIDGDYGEAIPALKTALSIRPGNRPAIRALARSHLVLCDPAAALVALREIPDRRRYRGRFLARAGTDRERRYAACVGPARAHGCRRRARAESASANRRCGRRERSRACAIRARRWRSIRKIARRASNGRNCSSIAANPSRHANNCSDGSTNIRPTTPSPDVFFLLPLRRRIAAGHSAPNTVVFRWCANPSRRVRAPCRRGCASAGSRMVSARISRRYFSKTCQGVAAHRARHRARVLRRRRRQPIAPIGNGWSAPQQDVRHLGDERLIERIAPTASTSSSISWAAPWAIARACSPRARRRCRSHGSMRSITTGIAAMDYLISDPWLSPAGSDDEFTERLIRLPHGRLAYNPPPAPPPTLDAPDRQRFVSLNRFSKINAQVIEVWASILEKLPTWTLLLKARGYDDDLAAHIRVEIRARRHRSAIASRSKAAEPTRKRWPPTTAPPSRSIRSLSAAARRPATRCGWACPSSPGRANDGQPADRRVARDGRKIRMDRRGAHRRTSTSPSLWPTTKPPAATGASTPATSCVRRSATPSVSRANSPTRCAPPPDVEKPH